MRLLPLVILSIACGTTLATAQNNACVDRETTRTITLEVRAPNLADPLTGFEAAHFLLDGKGVRPEPLRLSTNLPADIVVLIEERSRGGLLAGAADLLLKSALPQDQFAVLTYGVSTDRELAFSQDRAKIQSAIEKGSRGGILQVPRPLYGVVDALKLFPKPTPGRLRAILMFGDGQDQTSQIRIEQLAANLIAEQVSLDLNVDPAPPRKIPRINVAPPTLGRDTPGQAPPPIERQSVADLARWTGGFVDQSSDAAFLQRMRERLKQRLSLDYCVEKKHANKVPTIRLSNEARAKWPDAIIAASGVTASPSSTENPR